MKFLIIGTGGIGATLGGFLAVDGNDVSFIARGKNLEALQEKGLQVKSSLRGDFHIPNVKAMTAEQYNETPDVVFVCVKFYSLDDATQLVGRVAGPDTVVIPILNVYGTGAMMQEKLPGKNILDGCIYVNASLEEPGLVVQRNMLRIVYGQRDGARAKVLGEIAEVLEKSGITAVVTQHIQRDCFQKYALISPLASVGSYYNATTGQMRDDKEKFDTFLELTKEILEIAKALGIEFEVDIYQKNLDHVNSSAHDSITSMHRDILKGGASEIDGLLFEPIRLAKKHNIKVPTYEKIAKKFGMKLD
jgi:2-dehydropantoate 2-reductase